MRRLGDELKQCLREAKETKKKTRAQEIRLYKTYGLSLNDYYKMLSDQGNVCWICHSLPPSGRLCVDHVHIKGFKTMPPEQKVLYTRGLLCFLCNTGLKGFEKTSDGKKNRQRLDGTYKYFQKFRLKGEL